MRFLRLFFILLFLFQCTAEPEEAAPKAEPSKTELRFAKELLLGKITFSKDKRFVEIAPLYASRKGMYLRKETYAAFQKMHKAAKKAGLRLVIRSAGRNFWDQKRIWEAKWTGKRIVEGKRLNKSEPVPKKRALKILRFSSMPGTSRHHWGTDIDLNSLNNAYFTKGEGKRIYDWLQKNAPRFGFCQPYTSKKGGRTGYEEERWHWSYKPLAAPMLRAYLKEVRSSDISGFLGASTAKEIGAIHNYVAGVDPACK